MRRLVALVVCASLSACSFALVHGPKPPPAKQSDCTKSRTVPIIDAAVASVLVIFALSAALVSDREYNASFCNEDDGSCSPPGRGFTIGSSLLIAAADGAGAYYGFTRVQACRNANPDKPVEAPPPVAPVVKPPPPSPTGTGSGSDPPIPAAGLPVPGG